MRSKVRCSVATVEKRVDELEREVRPGAKQRLAIFQRGDVYYNGGEALAASRLEELRKEFDVFIVEVMDAGEDDEQ